MLQKKYFSFVQDITAWFHLANSIPHHKRAIFIPIILLSAGLLLFDLVFTTPLAIEPLIFFLNAIMLVVLVAAVFLLWQRVPRQELLLLVLFLVACIYVVTLMTYQTQQFLIIADHVRFLESVSPWLLWLIVLDVACFFTFRAVTALRLSLVMAAITLVGVVSILVKARVVGVAAAHDILALALANALVILFVYQMARTQERSSQTDFLTGLPNRMCGYAVLEYELERAARHHTMFTVILFDIDHFKKVNDLHGHSAGDAVLCDFAGFVQQHIRRTDILARWGGEEFILIMPESDLASGRLKADHLRQQIKNRAFHNGIRLSSSFGVTAFYPRDTTNTLLERADAALYRAKANGRNCVETE